MGLVALIAVLFLIGVLWGLITKAFSKEAGEPINVPEQLHPKRAEVLRSLNNLERKLDQLEVNTDDWQTRTLILSAWMPWVKYYGIEETLDREVRKRFLQISPRLVRICEGLDEKVPKEVRHAFAARHQRLRWNLERWEPAE